MREFAPASPEAMVGLGAELIKLLAPGDIVLLSGELGAGKTTLVRGMLQGVGYDGPVRSPTFNILQEFSTSPPILHVDLYRLNSGDGVGIEDYFGTHICLIEWPDRWPELANFGRPIHVEIEFDGSGRKVTVRGLDGPVQS